MEKHYVKYKAVCKCGILLLLKDTLKRQYKYSHLDWDCVELQNLRNMQGWHLHEPESECSPKFCILGNLLTSPLS